jgi:hypothetical protein
VQSVWRDFRVRFLFSIKNFEEEEKMKKRLVAMLLASLLLFSTLNSVAATASTANQPSGWATEQVKEAILLELVPVNLQSNYQNPITRAEFTALAVALYETVMGKEITERATFDDTSDSNVQKMGGLGVVSGVGNGYFNPNDTLTREQAAVILAELADSMGRTLPSASTTFTDNDKISAWAINAVGQVQAVGIMNGTGNGMFSPKTNYTREQSISTLLRLYELIGANAEPISSPNDYDNPSIGNSGNPNTITFNVKIESPTASVTETYQFNMNDPNVQAFPILATARTADELRAGSRGWQSATEIKAEMHDTHPDRLVDGMTVYEWRFKAIFEWVDRYLALNNINIAGMSDYEKTAVIRKIIEEGRLEEFIGLWRPNFRFTNGNCASRAEAVRLLMLAMDFELFRTVSGRVGIAHGWNAYWDSTVGAVRFVDADLGFGVWNAFIVRPDRA